MRNKISNPKSQLAMLQSYIDSPKKQRELYRRTLTIIVISQIFGGAGLAAGITIVALLGLGWNFGLISGTALIIDATDIVNIQ